MRHCRDAASTFLAVLILLVPEAAHAARAAHPSPAADPAPARPVGGVHAGPPRQDRVHTDTAALRRSLEQLVAAHAGVAGVSVLNLGSGEAVSIRGHETFPSASLIKVAVLVTLLDEVARGRIGLDERSTLLTRDRVGGSGVLKLLAAGIAPSMEDLAWLMITISDNTATNMILDKIDVRTVWTKMEALGLPHSKIHSKTFRRETSLAVDSSVIYGLGVTTPDETVRLFALLHEGRAVSPELDSLAVRMLLANQDGALLTRWLPGGTRVAHKSGTIDRARNDCGIIYSPAAPVALCVMTRENEDTSYGVDNPAHLLTAAVAREVFRHYNPDVALPPLPALPPASAP